MKKEFDDVLYCQDRTIDWSNPLDVIVGQIRKQVDAARTRGLYHLTFFIENNISDETHKSICHSVDQGLKTAKMKDVQWQPLTIGPLKGDVVYFSWKKFVQVPSVEVVKKFMEKKAETKPEKQIETIDEAVAIINRLSGG